MPTETDDLTVPEYNAANPDGGAERLDADTPTQTDLDAIDAGLDAAGQTNEDPAFTRNVSESDGQGAARNPDGTFAKVEEKPQETQAAQPDPNAAQAQQADPDLDPEIAAIQMPPNMSEKQQSNWRKLTSKLTESASTAKRYAAELEELKRRIAEQENSKQLPEDYEELKRFRSIFDLKNDPAFKSRHEEPIKNFSESIYDILKKNKAPEEIIKAIQDRGGPHKIEKAWWRKNIIERLESTDDGYVDAERLKKALVGLEDAEIAREKELEASSTKQQEWMQQRQQEAIQRITKDTEAINKYLENVTKEHAWARYQQAPPNATPEQLQKIQAHNARVDDLSAKFNSALNATVPEERAAVATAAVMSHLLVEQLRGEQASRTQLQKELDALRKENSLLKQSGKMPKSNVQGQQAPKSSLSERIKMDSSTAIDLGLEEAGA